MQQLELYVAFSAAYDGCEDCARQALDSGSVGVNQQSDSSAFDLMQWAMWGDQEGNNDTRRVQELLLSRGAKSGSQAEQITRSGSLGSDRLPSHAVVAETQQTERNAETSQAEQITRSGSLGSDRLPSHTIVAETQQTERNAETCEQSHTRACDPAHAGQPYKFFSAAFAGCRRCVRRFTEEGGDPAAQSKGRRHNALDWATFGKAEGEDADWVIGFLDGKGLKRTTRVKVDDVQEPTERRRREKEKEHWRDPRPQWQPPPGGEPKAPMTPEHRPSPPWFLTTSKAPPSAPCRGPRTPNRLVPEAQPERGQPAPPRDYNLHGIAKPPSVVSVSHGVFGGKGSATEEGRSQPACASTAREGAEAAVHTEAVEDSTTVASGNVQWPWNLLSS